MIIDNGLATGSLSISGSLIQSNGNVVISGSFTVVSGSIFPLQFNRQATNYVLSLADQGVVIETNVGSANTITVPLNATVPFPRGTEIAVIQRGTGQTSFVTASVGITLNSYNNSKAISGQYAAVSLLKVDTNEWYLVGRLA